MALATVTIPVRDVEAVKEGRANAVEMIPMQKMASKMWPVLTTMGVMIVAAAFVVGIINSFNVADFFGETKAVREATTNSDIGSAMAVKAWLPGMKFFGLGLMLGGITMLLATILGNLRIAGANVQAALGGEVILPRPPMIAKIFPMLMITGMMILLAAMIISAWLGTVAGDVWGRSIATEINVAEEGSALLARLGTLNAVSAWLAPFKFVGMAVLFSGIALALATIVTVLRFQARRLVEIASK